MAIKPVTAQEAAIKKILENPANEIQGAVSYTNPQNNTMYKYTPTVKVGAQDSGIQKILSNPNNEINGGVSYEKGNTRYSYTPSYNAPQSPSYTQSGYTGGNKDFYDSNGNLRSNITQEAIDAAKAGRFGRDVYGPDSVEALKDLVKQKVAQQGGYFEGGDVDEWFDKNIYQPYAKEANRSLSRQYLTNLANSLLNSNVGSQYDALYQQLLEKYNNYSFDNFKNSTAYQSMRNLYETTGKKAMKNVLGEIAARTGGYASSYATAAAQEQYNDYMAQLAQIAQQMYSGEKNSLLSDLKMVGDRADNERSMIYQGNLNKYNALKGIYDQQQAEKAQEEQAQAQAEANARQSAIDYLTYQVNTAGVPLDQLDPEMVAQSGIPYTQLMALAKEYQDKLAQQQWKNSMEEDTHNLNWAKYGLSASKAGRSSGGGGGSRKSTGGNLTPEKTTTLNASDIKETINYMRNEGMSSSDIQASLNDAYKSGGITKSNYQLAIKILRG